MEVQEEQEDMEIQLIKVLLMVQQEELKEMVLVEAEEQEDHV